VGKLHNTTIYKEKTFYHIYNRGNRKGLIFWNSSDYLRFLTALKEYEKVSDLIVYGYCLMPNHYHLLILLGLETASISKYMQKVMTSYAMYFNKKYQLVGHICQGAFRVKRLESIGSILRVIKYMSNNPVEANLVRRSEDYRWLNISLKYEEERIYYNDTKV